MNYKFLIFLEYFVVIRMVLFNMKIEILELLIWEGDIFLSMELEMEFGVVLKSILIVI